MPVLQDFLASLLERFMNDFYLSEARKRARKNNLQVKAVTLHSIALKLRSDPRFAEKVGGLPRSLKRIYELSEKQMDTGVRRPWRVAPEVRPWLTQTEAWLVMSCSHCGAEAARLFDLDDARQRGALLDRLLAWKRHETEQADQRRTAGCSLQRSLFDCGSSTERYL